MFTMLLFEDYLQPDPTHVNKQTTCLFLAHIKNDDAVYAVSEVDITWLTQTCNKGRTDPNETVLEPIGGARSYRNVAVALSKQHA